MKPFVSILMGVYNGEKFLRETLKSICGQTYTNWECIIVDDCSSDRTPEILAEFAARDPRFIILRNEENSRIPRSINRVLERAKGEYIVRTDADDISRRDRLEKQVAFMEAHPELSMSCSRWYNLKGDQAYPVFPLRRGESDQVEALFLFYNPIGQSASIIRTEAMRRFRYDPHFTYAEDLDLCVRILEAGEHLAIQEDYLLLYRVHGGQVSQKYRDIQRSQYQEIISRMFERMLFPLSQEELAFLTDQIYYRAPFSPCRFGRLVRKIRAAARQRGTFSDRGIRYAACEVLLMRRDLAEGKLGWLRELLRLGPFFAAGEIARRAAAKRKTGRQAFIYHEEKT